MDVKHQIKQKLKTVILSLKIQSSFIHIYLLYLQVAGPLEEKAMVMAVFDKAFDIFILRLGVTKRVYCDVS